MCKRRLLAAVVLALVGLGTPLAALGQEASPLSSDYVVQPGDWLSKIAQAEYGDAGLYPAIVLATNRAAMADA
ncbi:MAG: hypothetical protein JXA74_14795, partial [Anaerolineae bacterium]|nr:hypothetical protein [Anaerolineae bacterium]